METFYSIQGEGFHQGKAAYFIRLAGCDVGCHWCDVKESWDADAHPKRTVDSLIQELKETPAQLVIITGGEPLMYDLSFLCEELHKNGLQVHIETSGAHPYSGDIDWVCLSPKKFKLPEESFYQLADELKVVVFHPSDIKWAQELSQKVKEDCKLYLQPEWDRSDKVLEQIISFVKENPTWNISLQTHKYMNIL